MYLFVGKQAQRMPNNTDKNQEILFVINPISGDIDKNHMEAKIERLAQKRGFTQRVYLTSGDGDAEKIKDLIARSKPDKVMVAGGDGTINLVAKILAGTSLPMGIIPMGSANGLAAELQIPTALEPALELAITGKPKAIDVLKVNREYLLLHLGDIGFNAQVVKRFENDDVRGIWGYSKHFFSELMAIRSLKFRVTLNGETFYKHAFMVVVANATRYGTGAVVNPTGKMDDGFFEVIFMRNYTFGKLISMVIPFFTKKIHTLENIDIYRCEKIKIENLSKQPIQLDGEIVGRLEEIIVEVAPQSLQILMPV